MFLRFNLALQTILELFRKIFSFLSHLHFTVEGQKWPLTARANAKQQHFDPIWNAERQKKHKLQTELTMKSIGNQYFE
jgi:hypothetical protein